MSPNSSPTKDNLILAKSSLAPTRQDHMLVDKERNILIRGLMELVDQAKDIQSRIDMTFREACLTLQVANIELGINYIQEISASVPIETGTYIKTRSIMGTEIPLVQRGETPISLTYAYYSTEESLDEARARFEKVRELTIKLSVVKNPAYRPADNIKKARKRTSALKDITVPMYNTLTKNISNALEEREREGFTRLKVVKRSKTKAE